jgi:hypothetical protein
MRGGVRRIVTGIACQRVSGQRRTTAQRAPARSGLTVPQPHSLTLPETSDNETKMPRCWDQRSVGWHAFAAPSRKRVAAGDFGAARAGHAP